MKQLLTILLLLVVTASGVSQDRLINMNNAYENGTFIINGPIKYGSSIRGTYPGAITGADSYFDYMTNGNSMANMWASGDTMVVAYFGADQSDPTGATSRVAYYVVSTDKGATWGTPLPLTSLPRRSAYPYLAPYVSGIGRNIGFTGRLYTGTISGGGAYTDAFFGLGSITASDIPNSNRDFFGETISGSFLGGIAAIAGGASDTLNFWKYDMSTNTFTATTPVQMPGTGIDANVRWTFVSNEANDMIAVWWNSLAGAEQLNLKRSSDGGTTWGSLTTIQQALGLNGVINGDTCGPWFGIDGAYEPGTTNYSVVWSTLYPTGTGLSAGDNQGTKVLFWNPSINGGVPVEVAGKINMTLISDTNLFNPVNNQPTNLLQVGVTPVSHPSIGYNNTGAICVVFSGYQPLPDSLDGFFMNDIYYSLSYDGGATWSTPANITNTSDWDELYPVVSPKGNTNEFFIHYQATRGPGSQSFTNAAPTYVVHQVFDIIPTSGIQNISSEIPNGFSLKQNFPNPFNPSTSIRFNIPKASLVSLKVYDVTGKEVAALVSSENLAAGTFQYDFSAKSLASGMYFYTLTAGDYKETKKMMLVK